MKITRRLNCLTILSVVVFSLTALSHAAETENGQADQKRARSEVWIERITTELAKLDEKQRSSEAYIAVYSMAKAGEVKGAKELVENLLPPEERIRCLFGICDALSQNDQMAEALALIGEIPQDTRQLAIGLIGVRQAQRGDLDDAVRLLAKVTAEGPRDRLLAVIAEAQMKAGELGTAIETTKQISDKQRRRQTEGKIAEFQQLKTVPLDKLHSSLLREQLTVMLLFSASNEQREAMLAILAAQKKDQMALARHTTAALAVVANSAEIERATTFTLLAVAFVEAGDQQKAKEMILQARDANTKEWLGVSSIFGSPVLVHLLIRLQMQEELKALMNRLQKTESIGGPIAYQANLQAIGGTYAELDRLHEAEREYERLESPVERVHFASGVLMNLP